MMLFMIWIRAIERAMMLGAGLAYVTWVNARS